MAYPGSKGKSNHRNFEELGTGALQVAQILAYFFYYRPRLLLLDEPEVHLHPDLQKKLIETLAEITNDMAETQIIITSHSRHVLDALLRGTVDEKLDHALMIGCPESGGEHFVIEITDANALDIIETLGAQDFTRNISFVVYTEDSDTSLLEKLLAANGFNLKEGKIIPYKGTGNFNKVKTLDAFFTESNCYSKSTPVIIWRDSDLAPREVALNHWQEICSSFQGCLITSWPGSAVEGEFIHAAQKGGIDIENYIKDDEILKSYAPLGLKDSLNTLGLKMWPNEVLAELVNIRRRKHGSLGSTKSKELFKELLKQPENILTSQQKEMLRSPDHQFLKREDLRWLAEQIKERKSRQEIHDLWTAENQENFSECKGFSEPHAQRSQKLESLLNGKFEDLRIKNT